jgi:hypothetical protein
VDEAFRFAQSSPLPERGDVQQFLFAE